MDAAAEDFARTYNAKSIKAKQEYGSAIYVVYMYKWNMIGTGRGLVTMNRVISATYYSYTKPAIGKRGNSVTPKFMTIHRIVTTIHTHANYDNENFSTGFGYDIGDRKSVV